MYYRIIHLITVPPVTFHCDFDLLRVFGCFVVVVFFSRKVYLCLMLQSLDTVSLKIIWKIV